MNNSFTVILEIHECINCGVPFGLTPEYRQERQKDHKSFRCPNGHTLCYSGKNTEEKLKADLSLVRGQRDRARECCDRKNNTIEYFQRVAAANKGVVTRMRNKERKQNEDQANVLDGNPSLPV